MSFRLLCLTSAALLIGLSGCRCGSRICGPQGTMQYQQYNATLHDPYTDADAGPEVVGGRPRDYEKPLAEPVRSRLFRDNWLNR